MQPLRQILSVRNHPADAFEYGRVLDFKYHLTTGLSGFEGVIWSVIKKKVRTCSSRVNDAASSRARSSGRSREKIFFPVMASSEGETSPGVEAGVKEGVSRATGWTWIAGCFKSMCLMFSSVGLVFPRLIVAMLIK